MSETELQELLAEWQERLRLQDWRVTVALQRYHEMPSRDLGGHCEYNIQRRAARITLKHPKDEEDIDGDHSLDTEGYLVHELLHLHSLHYCPEGAENDLFEQGLNAIAAALVTLKRERDEIGNTSVLIHGVPGQEKVQPVTCHDCAGVFEAPDTFHCVDLHYRCRPCYGVWKRARLGGNATTVSDPVLIKREVAAEMLEAIREADWALKVTSTPKQCQDARQGLLSAWAVLERALKPAAEFYEVQDAREHEQNQMAEMANDPYEPGTHQP